MEPVDDTKRSFEQASNADPAPKQAAPSKQANPPPRSKTSGVPFAEILKLPLSETVREVIAECRAWADRERLRGRVRTGLLLLVLDRFGDVIAASPTEWEPRLLHQVLRRLGGDRFEIAAKRFLDTNREGAASRYRASDAASPNVRQVFDDAQSLPSHDGIIASRHLVVALLSVTPENSPSVTTLLEDAGIDRREVLAEFLQGLATSGPREERDQWAALAASHSTPGSLGGHVGAKASRAQVSATGTVTKASGRGGPLIAGYSADTPTGSAADDCLDLDASVNAIANLIASTQLDGTLSLGVFGNWGSGKSFFMKRLRAEIDAIAKLAREADVDGEAPAYWSNIAQVEFNAWHYVDANLWASLMSHLLDVLRRWNPEDEPPKADSAIAQAIEKLEITANARSAAEARKQTAAKAEEKAKAALTVAKTELGSAAEKLGKLVASSVWSFVESKVADERARATKALEDLELIEKGTHTSVEALFAQVRDVASTSGRLHTIAHRLLRDGDGAKRLIRLTLVVFVAVALIVAASWWAEWLRNAAAVVSAAIVGFTAIVGRALQWVQQTAAVVHEKLAPLRAARASIEQKLGEAETEKATRIAEAEKDVAMARTRVEAAAADVAARERELREAEQALLDAISGRAVRQFIEQRLAAGDYQKHLGLIAMIRRDFEQLGELIRAHNCNRRKLETELASIQKALLSARPELQEKDLVAMFQNIGINRIVLYIDDLDRCPSSRVVEVLQAIHLLVSFPIFVVVVGVDSRWMAHSLAREYPALLMHTANGDPASGTTAEEENRTLVTPADYLEKIFQIPYWVPPLHRTAAQKLISKLTESPADGVPFGSAPTRGESAAEGGSGQGALAGGAARSGPAAASPGGDRDLGDGGNADPGNEERRHPPALRPDLLRIAAEERVSMQSLAALIGRSPRATKRFVNSYRLLKVALVTQEPARFARDSEGVGHLSGPMILLAVIIGLPTLAAEFVRMLPENPEALVVDQLSALAKWADGERQHAFAAQRIREFTASDDAAPWQTLRGADLQPWVTRVGQFSFEDLHD